MKKDQTIVNYDSMSLNELRDVINNANKSLQRKIAEERKDVITRIKELASSIDIQVEISEAKEATVRKGVKVAIKYRDPSNEKNTWTGRGMMPKWLKNLTAEGRELAEFEVH